MARLKLTLSIALLGLAASAQAARHTPEEDLARAVKGRVAGAPVDCIQLRDIRSSQILPGIGILYDTGGTLYLNRPDHEITSVHADDILVTDTHGPQLCSIDIVKLLDRSVMMPAGFISLGKFTPYRRPK